MIKDRKIESIINKLLSDCEIKLNKKEIKEDKDRYSYHKGQYDVLYILRKEFR